MAGPAPISQPMNYRGFQEWMEKTSVGILEELEKAGVRLIPPVRWVEAPDEVRGPTPQRIP